MSQSSKTAKAARPGSASPLKIASHDPAPRFFRERIGSKEYELREEKLDVIEDITLWSGNPRLQPYLAIGEIANETELEESLRRSAGYDGLVRSIAQIGQMEPIYVWKRPDMEKYLVLEGSTRVTILRELYLKRKGKPEAERFRYVTVKVLPSSFGEVERVILLARIHVRGSGVRSWGRYVEAKFIHDSVTVQGNQKPLMTLKELADEMQKSVSWVSRLKDAYDFAAEYVDHFDDDDAVRQAVSNFSVLEEISKSTNFGAKLRNPADKQWEKTRGDVFEMVRNEVFKEYRDARFMQQFFDDPEKWAQLKSHEAGIAHKLANELKVGTSGLKGRVAGLYGQVERTLEREPDSLDDDDLTQLKQSVGLLETHLHGTNLFRHRVREFITVVEEASLSDVKKLSAAELASLEAGLEDLQERRKRVEKKSA
jgi:putative cofactor-binding repeat protein